MCLHTIFTDRFYLLRRLTHYFDLKTVRTYVYESFYSGDINDFCSSSKIIVESLSKVEILFFALRSTPLRDVTVFFFVLILRLDLPFPL